MFPKWTLTMEDVPCLRREPLVHTWWEPRTNLHAGQKKIEMFGPSKGHIASSQIESGSDKVHLCIWDVPPLSLDAKENQHQLL